MNETSIIVHYSHIADASCEVYDYKKNVVYKPNYAKNNLIWSNNKSVNRHLDELLSIKMYF